MLTEIRTPAAIGGIDFPDGFTELLDFSKFVDENGDPCTESIATMLKPFGTPIEEDYPELQGAGFYRDKGPLFSQTSLDARHR